MDETSLSRRTRLLIIIISILLHALLLIAIFLAIVAEQEREKSQQDRYETPVILSQSPETNQEAQVIFYEDAPMQGESGASAEPTLIPQEMPEDITPSPEDQPEVEAKEPAMQEVPMPDMRQSAVTVPLEMAEPVQKIDEEAPTSKIKTKKQKKKQKGIPSQQPVTLSQITQGFLESLHQEQGARPQTIIDQEEMARHRYGTKVWSMVRQSYKAYRSPTHLFTNITTDAVFVITIRKDGSLAHVELRHPQKNHDLREIEQILVHAAKKAGLFPPIPQQFKTDTMTLSFPLAIRAHQGVHTYDLLYN